MLIECPECKKEVSDQAATCPNCGFRIQKVQTIKKTRKGWKPMQLLGAVVIALGCGSYLSGKAPEASIIIVAIGAAIFIIGCIGTW